MTVSTFFLPNRQIVQAITRANPGVVTTTTSHGYRDGLFVRFVFPENVGMMQLSNQSALITVLSPTTFSIDINTSSFDAFNSAGVVNPPQVIPIGEVASTLANAVDNGGHIVPET